MSERFIVTPQNVKDLLKRSAEDIAATEKKDREYQTVVDLWFWNTIEISYTDPEREVQK